MNFSGRIWFRWKTFSGPIDQPPFLNVEVYFWPRRVPGQPATYIKVLSRAFNATLRILCTEKRTPVYVCGKRALNHWTTWPPSLKVRRICTRWIDIGLTRYKSRFCIDTMVRQIWAWFNGSVDIGLTQWYGRCCFDPMVRLILAWPDGTVDIGLTRWYGSYTTPHITTSSYYASIFLVNIFI